MKRLLLTAFTLILAVSTYAQTPQAVCYQAVAIGSDGSEIANQMVGVQMTIHRTNLTGDVVWQERHIIETDEFGLFALDIGRGTFVSGLNDFDDIEWGADTYWIKVEMAENNDNNFVLMGANQILSVPYALHAESAGVADSAVFADSAATAGVADMAITSMTSMNDNDTSATNEIQELIFDPSTSELFLTGSANSPVVISDGDADSENELQTLNYEDGVISISGVNGGIASQIDLSDHAFSAPGASVDFPLGIRGDHQFLSMGIYEVPAGHTLYVTAGPPDILFFHNDIGVQTMHPTTPNMPIFKEGTTITNCRCTGILIEDVPFLTPITFDLTDPNATYEVPAGVDLFIKSGLSNQDPAEIMADGVILELLRPNFTRGTRVISFPSGTTLARPDQALPDGDYILTGYLLSIDQ